MMTKTYNEKIMIIFYFKAIMQRESYSEELLNL